MKRLIELSVYLIELEPRLETMSNEVFRKEAMQIFKSIATILNHALPITKESNLEGLKNLDHTTDGNVKYEGKNEWKYEPTEKELEEIGFGYFAYGEYRICKSGTAFRYSAFKRKLMKFNGDEIPFHTKEDFMKAIGVSNIEELAAEYDRKKLAYTPSEEILRELGFNSNGKKYFEDNCLSYFKGKFHWLNINYGKVIELFPNSDTELRMLVEILQRQK